MYEYAIRKRGYYMVDLKGKKVMVFSPYGATKHYGQAIITELKKRGAIVYDYDERPSQNAWMKIVIRLLKKKIPQIFDNYISKIIKSHKGEKIDYILICKGEAFTPYTIKHLRDAFNGVYLILYSFDVMCDTPMEDVISSYDRVLSFDPEDSKMHNLIFRPLFYVDDYLSVKDAIDSEYDLCFVGTLYHPRHLFIKNLLNKFENQDLKVFTYLYVPGFIMFAKEYIFHFPFMPLKKVRLDPLSVDGTIDILNRCKAILDLNPPFQTSLSSRAVESLVTRRKFITINKHIKDYEFYNPNNILVIDIENPIVPKEFLDSPYQEVEKDVLYKYSVVGFVDSLFDF